MNEFPRVREIIEGGCHLPEEKKVLGHVLYLMGTGQDLMARPFGVVWDPKTETVRDIEAWERCL